MPGKKNRDKAASRAWKGLLSAYTPMQRGMIAAILAVSCLAIAFTQLGFIGIGAAGEYGAYAIVMIIPVVLTALLLGTRFGALMGLIAGAVLLLHAKVMPLGYYELVFVTPFTSVIMLALSGLLAGRLFRRALRNDPAGARRIVYIILVCIVISWFYSTGFVLGSIGAMILQAASDIAATEAAEATADLSINTYLLRFIMRLGDVPLQTLVDALLMAVSCILTDLAVAFSQKLRSTHGVRYMFSLWMLGIAALCFMIMEAATFFAITEGERARAYEDIRSEVHYILNQLQSSADREAALEEVFDNLGIPKDATSGENFDALLRIITNKEILDGFSEDLDGVVTISSLVDGYLFLSDMPDFTTEDGSAYLNMFLSSDTLAAIDRSVKTGEVQRVIYNPGVSDLVDQEALDQDLIHTEIGFLYSSTWSYYCVTMIQPASIVFAERARVMAWSTASNLVLLAAVFLLTSRLLENVVVKRIDETNDVLARITSGDLEAHVDVRAPREFESLSTGINTTVDALKGWIEEAETRMDAELSAAKAIQESALPSTFPPFPNNPHFDIFATMDPAREVGGDFYDFFMLAEDSESPKLGFLIADVSGKGVPASLFMMKAKTLIHDYLVNGVELGEAVENANRQLYEGNDANMFVTAWIAVLDYATGHIDFVNAGHNPPLLWASAEDDPDPFEPRYARDGAWGWLKQKSGIPLGMFEGLPYKVHSIDCKPGDMLLLYTDGVTEAMDADGNLYGDERLMTIAEAASGLHPRMLATAVHESIESYADGAEQSDDITILALEYGVPPEVTATITVPARVSELANVNAFIHNALDRRFCPKRIQAKIDIAVEELFVNVASYAYPDATDENPGEVRVSYSFSAEPPSITITITDNGIPFDPLAVPDEKIPEGADAMKLRIGGLGILMAQKSVDEMCYSRFEDSNVVTLVKQW